METYDLLWAIILSACCSNTFIASLFYAFKAFGTCYPKSKVEDKDFLSIKSTQISPEINPDTSDPTEV